MTIPSRDQQQFSAGNDADTRARAAAKLAPRWGNYPLLLEDGFVPVARSFVKYAATLKPYGLQPAEMLFVLNLMYHKWDAARPYPAYKTIAARMGISVQYARDLARRLESKGLLIRQARVGQTNRFDLQPLFDALATRVAEENEKRRPRPSPER